jgi:hypothetical protein
VDDVKYLFESCNFYHAKWVNCLFGFILMAYSAVSVAGVAQTPLFLSTNVKPNIMLMLDNSGSMSNIVPETPYDPNTTYIATCPVANLIPTGGSVEITIASSLPKIRFCTSSPHPPHTAQLTIP